jgi:hypothetical protein
MLSRVLQWLVPDALCDTLLSAAKRKEVGHRRCGMHLLFVLTKRAFSYILSVPWMGAGGKR